MDPSSSILKRSHVSPTKQAKANPMEPPPPITPSGQRMPPPRETKASQGHNITLKPASKQGPPVSSSSMQGQHAYRIRSVEAQPRTYCVCWWHRKAPHINPSIPRRLNGRRVFVGAFRLCHVCQPLPIDNTPTNIEHFRRALLAEYRAVYP